MSNASYDFDRPPVTEVQTMTTEQRLLYFDDRDGVYRPEPITLYSEGGPDPEPCGYDGHHEDCMCHCVAEGYECTAVEGACACDRLDCGCREGDRDCIH